jgi:hypothetical protein
MLEGEKMRKPEKKRWHGQHFLGLATTGILLLSACQQYAETKALPERQSTPSAVGSQEENVQALLPGDRIVVGVVEEVTEDQVKVTTGEVQPRYLPLAMAREKGFPPMKAGDKLRITLNEQNLLVDYHPFGVTGKHRLLRGVLVAPLVIGHEQAVIRTKGGKEESFEIRPLARSKTAAIPIGAPALFLLDETNKITDVFFGNEQALERSEREYQTNEWQGSLLKGAQRRVPATIVKTVENGKVTIRTEAGKEHRYEIRPFAQDKLKDIRVGGEVILLLDNEDKIADVAVPPMK